MSDELQNAYWLALGKFLDIYGKTESVLAYYLARFVARRFEKDNEDGLALTRGLLGAQRSQGLRETIKRLLRITGADDESQRLAKLALDHFGEIHSLRDRIVHQSASPEFHEGGWAVRNTNVSQVKESSQVEEIYFTIEDLDGMSDDLWAIQILIRLALFPDLGGDLKGVDRTRFSQPTWQYKPSRLKRRRPQSRASGKAQGGPPQS